MPFPTLSVSSAPLEDVAADVIVLGMQKSPDGPRLLSDEVAHAPIAEALAQVGATGAADELRRLPALPGSSTPIALIGLGSEVTPDTLRAAAGAAARQLTGISRLAIALPIASRQDAVAALEGAAIGAYAYTEYRVATKAATKTPASEIVLLASDDLADQATIDRAAAAALAIHSVRDLVNMPPSDLYPETLAAAAVELAAGLPVEVEVSRRAPRRTWRWWARGSPSTRADSR